MDYKKLRPSPNFFWHLFSVWLGREFFWQLFSGQDFYIKIRAENYGPKQVFITYTYMSIYSTRDGFFWAIDYEIQYYVFYSQRYAN